MLKLTARIADVYPHGAIVGLCVNEVQCGVLSAKTEDADELVGVLGAATELLEVCTKMGRLCVDMHGWDSATLWHQLVRLTPTIDAAIAKAKGAT